MDKHFDYNDEILVDGELFYVVRQFGDTVEAADMENEVYTFPASICTAA